MKQKAYSVYDDKAAYFMPPFYCKTDFEAIRVFGFAVNDGQSSLSQIANDVSLYHVGEFDDSTGMFEGIKPLPLCRGSEHVKSIIYPLGGQTVREEGEDEIL